MRKNKLTIILAISVLMLATPAISIPRANAFHSGTISVSLTGTATQDYYDPYLSTTIDAGREGSPITFNVRIQASTSVGQRNLIVGAKFGWQTTWTNASNANPSDTYELSENQAANFAVSITLPTLSGTFTGYNLYRHTWEVRVWSVPTANTPAGPAEDCPTHGTLIGCTAFLSSNFGIYFAIYTGDMAEGVRIRTEASAKLSSLGGSVAIVFQPPPGTAKAVSDISQGEAALGLGDEAYQNGDFAAAKNHYQTALNYANSAAGALAGGDSATFSSTLMNGVGWLLIGVGVILAGLGAFAFLRRRAKA